MKNGQTLVAVELYGHYILPVDEAVAFVKSMTPVSYDWESKSYKEKSEAGSNPTLKVLTPMDVTLMALNK